MRPSVYHRRWLRIVGLYTTCWIGFPRMKRAILRLERLRKRKKKTWERLRKKQRKNM